MKPPIRILSDVHWGHPMSLVKCPEQLAPLFEGAGTMVFNGDTVEQQSDLGRDGARADAGAIAEVCRSAGADAVFLTGNHDPEVSDQAVLKLKDGEVLVMHGDVLFPDLSLWRRREPGLKKACESLVKPGAESEPESFDELINSVRKACARAIAGLPASRRVGFRRIFLKNAWPPTHPLRILQCWADMARRGALFAARYGNGTRVIVAGHTHFPGVWRRNDCLVVNTGSFFPIVGRSMVELEGGRLTVRQIGYRGRAFRVGKTVDEGAVGEL